MRSLYLSHIGMAEPLGQSQVLPYLIGLARQGVEIEILSFEATNLDLPTVAALRERLAGERITWRPMPRSSSHSLGMKLWEAGRALSDGLLTALRRRPDVVHARSYLPAAAADLIASLSPGARLLFDCRGMLADEYIDNGNWRREQVAYRLTKRYERRLFARTDGLVVLTEALHRWLREGGHLGAHTEVGVVPCCVDADRFRPDDEARQRGRRELGLGNRPVVVYSGTLGSWYLEREMALFVAALRRLRPDVAFLVLSRADVTNLRAHARAAGIPDGDLLVRSVSPTEMPSALAIGDVGLSFILPCFSKLGSSPTKVAEYLSSGLVVALNEGVGDQSELSVERSCVVMPTLDATQIETGARRVSELLDQPHAQRAATAHAVARARFSLAEIGVPRYADLYRRLSS